MLGEKIAGSCGKIIEYPFDTVKVRLQSQSHHAQYAGPLDCFKQSLRAEGVAGLYRGLSAPLFGAAVENSSLFFSYQIAKEIAHKEWYPQLKSREDLPFPALLWCGAASGAFTSILLTPIELVKCQLQVPHGQRAYGMTGPLSVMSHIYRHNGISGFWHGQMGTLIRETGGSAAWFGSYEGVKYFFAHDNKSTTTASTPPIWQSLLAGAAAGVSYNFLFYPADTIKSRMQTEQVVPGLAAKRMTFVGVGKALWQQQGIKGLYRGCGITVCRSAPSSAFIFSIYEGLKGYFA